MIEIGYNITFFGVGKHRVRQSVIMRQRTFLIITNNRFLNNVL